MAELSELSWSETALEQALEALARAAGLEPVSVFDRTSALRVPVEERIARAADRIGIEADEVDTTYAELPELLAKLGPALVRMPAQDPQQPPRFLALQRGSARRCRVLTPDGRSVHVACETLRRALCRAFEPTVSAHVQRWLSEACGTTRRAQRGREAFLALLLAERRLTGFWILRMDPGANFRTQLRQRRVFGRFALALLLALGQVLMTTYGWVLLGRITLIGVADPGWLIAWALTCASALPLQLGTLWLGSNLLNELACVLKQRLLVGALRMDPDRIRSQGSGRLLAIVSEAEAIEGVGLAGAFQALLGAIQLLTAAVTLALGAAGPYLVPLLALWCAWLAWLYARYLRLKAAATQRRFDLARRFVENVVGNRTRIVQQRRERWHVQEDRQLQGYVLGARGLTALETGLSVLPARGFFVLGFATLFVAALLQPPELVPFAIAVGGLLQASAALGTLSAHAPSIAGALIAWRSIAELFGAAAQRPAPGQAALPPIAAAPEASEPETVLAVRGVTYRYAESAEPVLKDCSLTLHTGERVLLEGRSGGGKSTLASLLVGLRSPSAGHVFLRGMDQRTLGAAAWRRAIASAPQFHENHVLTATFLFNLTMGRRWPPSEADRAEADSVCRELGLGPLIDRMPSGLNQIVGETGWQLSHGERSRLFLARALLQRAEVVVLDESFGALDPLTLQMCMRIVRERAPTLIVIAHP